VKQHCYASCLECEVYIIVFGSFALMQKRSHMLKSCLSISTTLLNSTVIMICKCKLAAKVAHDAHVF
jgi:hypothetical protein